MLFYKIDKIVFLNCIYIDWFVHYFLGVKYTGMIKIFNRGRVSTYFGQRLVVYCSGFVIVQPASKGSFTNYCANWKEQIWQMHFI